MKKTKFYKKQRIATSALLSLSVSFYLGQNVPVIKTPQTYSIEKFGNIPVSLNTGNVSYDINLFNYGDLYNGEGYNIGLRYFGNGFVPSKKSNYVGLDWSLDIGGAISREVRGVADDFFSEWTRTVGPYGYHEAMKNCGRPNSEIYNYNYPAFQVGNGGVWIKCGDRSFELEPDKFSFNFMGHSGYFFIGNDLKPIIVSEDKNLKIDISQLSSRQPLDANLSNGSKCVTRYTQIIITDGKGIKYYFGGDYENLEISYNLVESTNENKFTITAWNLYKIEYPNSNILEIKYRSIKPTFADRQFCMGRDNLSAYTEEPFLLLFDEHTVYKQYVESANLNYSTASPTVIFDGTIYWGNGTSYVDGDQSKTYATKKSLPETILLNGKKVVNFDFERYERYRDGSLPSLRLKNITFYDDLGMNILKEVNMSYYRNQDSFFLDHLKMFKKDAQSTDYLQHYSFDYYNKETLPEEVITPGLIDYWGYYNAFPRYKLIPNFNINKNTGDLVITDSKRDANPALASMSLLKSITYPTGGRSEFIYEPHNYSEKIDRNSSSQFKNTVIPSVGMVGGGRIQKIINYNNNGNQIGSKEFKYISNYTPNGSNTKSSGILSNYYLNISYLKTQTAYSNYEQLNAYSDNFIETTMNSAPVLYSEVTEIDNNKGYTKSYFTDQKSHPDSPLFKEIENDISINNKYYSPPNIGNINLPYRSNNYKRGKLFKQEIYDQNFRKLQVSTTDFIDITEDKPGNYVTYVTDNLRSKYFFKMFGGMFVPKKMETVEMFNAANLKTTSELFYEGNSHSNLTKKTITFPDNKVNTTTMNYAFEKGNQLMIDKNIVGNPLETIVTQSVANNQKTLSKEELIYPKTLAEITNNNAGLVLPLSIKSYDLQNIERTEITYDKYDNKGNLQQYTTKDGISTVIIWGYNQTQPIAKIEGVKLSDIQQSVIDSIVNASNTDASAVPNADETVLLSVLNTFRNSLSNYPLTTYTYDPLIGVRSITPPSGVREVYLYDSANRLKEIREYNQTGKLLKEFKYNYKNQ